MSTTRLLCASAFALTIPSSLAAAQSPADLVQRAATAMGGAANLRALNNATLEFHSVTFGLGQEETPSSPARATFVIGRTVTDYRGNRRLLTQQSRAVTGAMTQTQRITTATAGISVANNGAP